MTGLASGQEIYHCFLIQIRKKMATHLDRTYWPVVYRIKELRKKWPPLIRESHF